MLNYLYAIIIIVFGSYGTYVLFNEFVEVEPGFSLHHILLIFRRRWLAVFALSISITLFIYHLIDGINS